MDAGRGHLAIDDGNGLYGLCAALGADVLWGATVITNLFSAIPLVGDSIVTLLWGGFSVDNPTLNRFFALHYLMPFLIAGVVILHIIALHRFGSNNPIGIDASGPQDTIPFHPYYTIKDFFGLSVFLSLFAAAVFFFPNFMGHPDNYIPADPMQTPAHIVPEWYFLPFYAILRAVPDKLGGVLAMFGAIAVLFVLPWLDRSPVRSARFRPAFKIFFWLFAIDCVVLGYLGGQPAEGIYVVLSRVATVWYFLHFLVFLPLLSIFETPRPCRNRYPARCLAGGRPCRSSGKCREGESLMRRSLTAILLSLLAGPALAAGGGDVLIKERDWSFSGPLGTYDKAAMQRGFQAYQEVCAGCHSLDLIAFRNLADLGYNEAEIKAIAAEYDIEDGPDDDGEMFTRPGRPADRFPAPYANNQAARASNNGALPPDLSLIVKARANGANYLYSLLTSYGEAPAGTEVPDGMHYNAAYSGKMIAMPQPLYGDDVSYADRTVQLRGSPPIWCSSSPGLLSQKWRPASALAWQPCCSCWFWWAFPIGP